MSIEDFSYYLRKAIKQAQPGQIEEIETLMNEGCYTDAYRVTGLDLKKFEFLLAVYLELKEENPDENFIGIAMCHLVEDWDQQKAMRAIQEEEGLSTI